MPYPRKRFWLMGSVIAAACIGAVSIGVKLTSTTSFCLSCHEMRVYQDELMASIPATPKARNAVTAPCAATA